VKWFWSFLIDEQGVSVTEYLIGTAMVAGVAYACRGILVGALKTAHDAMVTTVTSITGN